MSDLNRPKKRLRKANRQDDSDSSISDDVDDDGGAAAELFLRRGDENIARPGPNMDAEDGGDRRRSREEDDEEEDGEDLLETINQDYRQINELDTYDQNDLDEDDYDPISQAARRAAEATMKEREIGAQQSQVRLPGMLQDDSDSSGDEEEDEERNRRRRQQYEHAAYAGDEENEPQETEPIDLETLNVPLQQFIMRDTVRNEIQRRFEDFLRTYSDTPDGDPVYPQRINAMCSRNSQSLVISYTHLVTSKTNLAIWLADAPGLMLPLLNQMAWIVVLDQFPQYKEIHDECFVRVAELPIIDTLRDLRTVHMNILVRVSGIITRRSQVLPKLKSVSFKCLVCSTIHGPHAHSSPIPMAAPPCNHCDDGLGNVVQDNELSVYRNYQRILLQESPGSVPPGRVPRYKHVTLLSDLIDTAKPGDEVEITGIYLNERNTSLNSQQGFPVFDTSIEANYVEKKDDLATSLLITDEDKREFRKLSKDPRVVERILASISPSIYGHKHVKTALALAMFGGREKNIKNKHRIRGDINVLLMGDPGTAKSQCLKYVQKTAPRAVYTTGKGASAVGLTAAVQKDPISREWVLEGGALVLADRGVCLIDEFDKMNEMDRVSIHEAMEQQSISISKAGIVTTLQARCSVIAAANPIGGRYDPQRSFSENVELTDPIIQRFDILCVLQDNIDPLADERLAKFVVASHVRSHPEGCLTLEEAREQEQERVDNDNDNPANVSRGNINVYESWCRAEMPAGSGVIDQELLRKYILYARTLKPQLGQIDQAKIEQLYTEIRKESVNSGGIPIAVRHVESIIRMSEAFSRMHLREYVRDDDVNAAIGVMLESFISAQKFSVMRQLKRSFQKYLTYQKDNNELLIYLLEDLLQQNRHMAVSPDILQVTLPEFERRSRELGVHDLSHFFQSDKFLQRGFVLQQNVIMKNFV